MEGSGKRLSSDEVIEEERRFYTTVSPNTGVNAYNDAERERNNAI